METFVNWLKGDLGTPGEYAYQPIYWYSLAAVAIVTAALLLCQHFLDGRKAGRGRVLTAVCIFQLVFELGWRLIFFFVKDCGWVALWPCYPCNLGGILLPIVGLTNWKTGKKLFYLFGFVGAVLTFAMPNGIFCTDVMVFPVVKSILQHTGILIIPLLEYASGKYRSTLKDMGWVLLGCLIHLVNCEGIDRLLGLTGDYMFFRSGMPFVIPGVPQFITLSVFAVAVLCLLSFASDPKGSVQLFKRKQPLA